MTGSLRVIAGALRGRRFRAPRGSGTRPTADRVRQAIFDLLGPLDGLRVADFFAGSGALGVEALSRGAAYAVFVESSRGALDVLTKNLDELRLRDRSTVLAIPFERAHGRVREEGPFDLVLCDPPWRDVARVAAELDRCIGRGMLSPDGRIVLEHPAKEAPELTAASRATARSWGDTGVSIFTVGS